MSEQQAQSSRGEMALGGRVLRVGALLMIFGVAWLGACSGNESEEAEKQAAAPEETTEETTQERTSRTRQASEHTPPPAPSTPEDRIRANIENSFAGDKNQLTIDVRPSEQGCYDVGVSFMAIQLTTRTTVRTIDSLTQGVHKAVYSDDELRSKVCQVTTDAWAEFAPDPYGNTSREMMYSTTLDRATAERINWGNIYAVNLTRLYRVNYEHPTLTQERQKIVAERAADCAVDEGFFDNWTCP